MRGGAELATPARGPATESGKGRVRQARCSGCGGLFDGARFICRPCLDAPPAWMRVTASFLAEEMGIAA